MHRSSLARRAVGWLGRALLGTTLVVLTLVGVGLAAIQTGWAKNLIRELVVRQANQYLTATLEIGELGGSLIRGLELGDIRMTRNGHTLVTIDRVILNYSIRELLQPGLVIRRISVVRPIIAARRQADGRWDLATLVKRNAREQERTGPGRPIEIASIAVTDGTVSLSQDVAFGAAHIPTRYERLDALLSFTYKPVHWALDFQQVSFQGSAPDLVLDRLSGGIENGPAGIVFTALRVATGRSAFTLDGRILRGERPTELDLQVHAARFAFQEWGGVLHGLRNIAVDAQFDTTLRGPLTRLATDLTFRSNAGGIRGTFDLNTTVPGWHGRGRIDAERIDLARWLNNPEKASDITGRTTFDLAFGFGEHFPRGSYAFDGPHAMFMHYAGDEVRAHGVLTADAAIITEATATAYGASIRTTDGSIALKSPYVYHFPGTVTSLDLRRLPAPIPVPHVESALALAYDVRGTFERPFIVATARFAPSEFLGARIDDGFVGTIDTSTDPVAYSGDGGIDNLDIARFGRDLDVGWMQDPRYAGTMAGRFHVAGSGGGAAARITGGGRVRRASIFGGRLDDADVSIDIANGSLQTSFDGTLAGIDPAVATGDSRWAAALTGVARLRVAVRGLLLRHPTAGDVDLDGTVTLRASTVHGFAVGAAEIDGTLRDGLAHLRRLQMNSADTEIAGDGAIPLPGCAAEGDQCLADFRYDIPRADLAPFKAWTGAELRGMVTASGRITGPVGRLSIVGGATVKGFEGPEFQAASIAGTYEIGPLSSRLETIGGGADAEASFASAFGLALNDVHAKVTLADGRVTFATQVQDARGRRGSFSGDVALGPEQRDATLQNLTVSVGATAWRLTADAPPPVVSWETGRVAVSDLHLSGPSADEQIGVSGAWRRDGGGEFRVTARNVALETLQPASSGPVTYGGVVNAEATIRGTRASPIVAGRVDVAAGRIGRFSYERLAGQVDYSGGDFTIDLRLDQSPGTWLTAKGVVPAGLIDRNGPERPIDVAITSSPIDLALVEGLTDTVRDVTGRMQIDVTAVGTSRDPHFRGTIDVSDAAFLVASTGVRYQRGRTSLRLAPDRIQVDALHLEDPDGRPLDVRGSLGTHELRVGDLSIEASARRFQVLRNEFGRVELDAALRLEGRFEAPKMVGDLSIVGGTLDVTEILDRTLLRPYRTEPIAAPTIDAVAALNPWDRLALDVSLHIPQELRLTGVDLQVAQGTPIGLGDVNLRVGGDLYLYKEPNDSLSITGSLDRMAGTYSFQGRRFDIDESRSSINFRGDVNPELYVSVTRTVSGVETRVTIVGDLHNPELRLTSTPPLQPSDILSLIVFNTSANALSIPQQQELAVRAATIAAGFLAKPIVSGIERSLGLDILEIEAADATAGTRVTIGEEIAPGLVARFSRQFGRDEFDEAVLEYSLSRLFRLRATFSDAGSSAIRTPFRRVERAGIDLLLFLSF